MKKTAADIQFQIDQLRKDQILSAIESCAVTLICGLLIFVGERWLDGDILRGFQLVLAGFAAGYLVLTWKRNFGRTKRIEELERTFHG